MANANTSGQTSPGFIQEAQEQFLRGQRLIGNELEKLQKVEETQIQNPQQFQLQDNQGPGTRSLGILAQSLPSRGVGQVARSAIGGITAGQVAQNRDKAAQEFNQFLNNQGDQASLTEIAQKAREIGNKNGVPELVERAGQLQQQAQRQRQQRLQRQQALGEQFTQFGESGLEAQQQQFEQGQERQELQLERREAQREQGRERIDTLQDAIDNTNGQIESIIDNNQALRETIGRSGTNLFNIRNIEQLGRQVENNTGQTLEELLEPAERQELNQLIQRRRQLNTRLNRRLGVNLQTQQQGGDEQTQRQQLGPTRQRALIQDILQGNNLPRTQTPSQDQSQSPQRQQPQQTQEPQGEQAQQQRQQAQNVIQRAGESAFQLIQQGQLTEEEVRQQLLDDGVSEQRVEAIMAVVGNLLDQEAFGERRGQRAQELQELRGVGPASQTPVNRNTPSFIQNRRQRAIDALEGRNIPVPQSLRR